MLFFFFQAEDGIRDVAVTGVQTCALPISLGGSGGAHPARVRPRRCRPRVLEAGWRSRCPAADRRCGPDRKSTRLNSSHGYISYAVFCLKKKKKKYNNHITHE